MLSRKDFQLLSFFRANARKPLTRISRETKIPVSTIFDKLKTYERTIIRKHTCIVDFKKLGFEIRVGMLIKADRAKRDELEGFLMEHHRVNTLLKITNDFDYFVEALFKNMAELQKFSDQIEEIGIEAKKELFIVEEVKREAFLSNPQLFDLFIKSIT